MALKNLVLNKRQNYYCVGHIVFVQKVKTPNYQTEYHKIVGKVTRSSYNDINWLGCVKGGVNEQNGLLFCSELQPFVRGEHVHLLRFSKC